MEVYKGLGEQDLARFCCKGDSLAKEELYRRYAARVYTLCRRYMPDRSDAEDLMQDTLIRALEKIDTFHYSEEGSLLYSVTPDMPEYQEAKRLLKFLDYFLSISSEKLPFNSIVREFVGGSCFKV